MQFQIKKAILDDFNISLRADSDKILADLVILIMYISGMVAIDSVMKGYIITLFDIAYNVKIMIFYLLGFVFILTTNRLFRDIREFLNLTTSFIIKKFPRMNGDFSPDKYILRDLVQIVMMMLIFYPVAEFVENTSIDNYVISYLISFAFIIMTLAFAYDITANLVKLISAEFQKISQFEAKNFPEEYVEESSAEDSD